MQRLSLADRFLFHVFYLSIRLHKHHLRLAGLRRFLTYSNLSVSGFNAVLLLYSLVFQNPNLNYLRQQIHFVSRNDIFSSVRFAPYRRGVEHQGTSFSVSQSQFIVDSREVRTYSLLLLLQKSVFLAFTYFNMLFI